MPNILLITNMYPRDDRPSLGVFVRNIEEDLRQSGHQVDVVSLSSATVGGMKIKRYLCFWWRAFTRSFAPYDYVYVHYLSHSSLPVLLGAALQRFILIGHIHGSDAISEECTPTLLKWTKRVLVQLTCLLASKIIVPSNYFKRRLIQLYKLDESIVVVSPSGGVDTNIFCPASGRTFNYRNPRIGYVGRLTVGKGVLTLLNAFVEIKRENPNVHLILVGPCSPEIEYRLNYNLESKINYLGEMSQQELSALYNSFDYLIIPTEQSESLGLVGLESMACGTPVISSDGSGPSEYVTNEKNGFLFKPGDGADMIKVILKAIAASVGEWKELSGNAVSTASLYDKRCIREEMAHIFQ